MKKVVSILLLLLAFHATSHAQKAFSNLALGVEVGTTGVGVELSLPIVTDHLVLKGGFMAPSFMMGHTVSLPATGFNAGIERVNSTLAGLGISESVQGRFSDVPVDMVASVNFSAARFLLEYYPFRKSSFHITAGAYFGTGNSDFLSVAMATGESFKSEYAAIKSEIDAINAKYPDTAVMLEDQNVDVSFSGTTYRLEGREGLYSLSAALVIPRVRPYLGLGIGRSVPDGRVGFQFEVGAWYHGTPSISSDNALDTYNPDAYSLGSFDISKIPVYPHVSLRITVKLI